MDGCWVYKNAGTLSMITITMWFFFFFRLWMWTIRKTNFQTLNQLPIPGQTAWAGDVLFFLILGWIWMKFLCLYSRGMLVWNFPVFSFPDFSMEVILASHSKTESVSSSPAVCWKNWCRPFSDCLWGLTGQLVGLGIFFSGGFKL